MKFKSVKLCVNISKAGVKPAFFGLVLLFDLHSLGIYTYLLLDSLTNRTMIQLQIKTRLIFVIFMQIIIYRKNL